MDSSIKTEDDGETASIVENSNAGISDNQNLTVSVTESETVADEAGPSNIILPPPQDCTGHAASDVDGSPTKKAHRKKKRPRRNNKRRAKGPYSVKNFLGRPKINAPANTTQFIFDDKETTVQVDSESDNTFQEHQGYSSSSDHDENPTPAASDESDLAVETLFPFNNDCNNFMTKEFARDYDDVHIDSLYNESVDQLTSKCMDLEQAIHSLRYLLQKEFDKKHKIEEILFLQRRNEELRNQNKSNP